MPAIMAEVTAHAILIKTILNEIRAAAMRAGFNISVIQKFDGSSGIVMVEKAVNLL